MTKSYLDNCSAVNWASYMREMFKEFFQGTIRYKVLSGEIEIDESFSHLCPCKIGCQLM